MARRRTANLGVREVLREDWAYLAQRWGHLEPALLRRVADLDDGRPVECWGYEIGLDVATRYRVDGDGDVVEVE